MLHSPPISAAANRFPGVSLLLTALAMVVFFSGGSTELFQFDRAAISSGQIWRIITGHWAHWSADHLFWDIATFALLAALVEMKSRGLMLWCVFGSAVAISAGVWFWLPQMRTYRGLSGIDSALFVFVAVDLVGRSLRHRERGQLILWGGCLLAFFLKTIYEMQTGATLFVDSPVSSMIPLPLVHVIGGAVGLFLGINPARDRPAHDHPNRTD